MFYLKIQIRLTPDITSDMSRDKCWQRCVRQKKWHFLILNYLICDFQRNAIEIFSKDDIVSNRFNFCGRKSVKKLFKKSGCMKRKTKNITLRVKYLFNNWRS